MSKQALEHLCFFGGAALHSTTPYHTVIHVSGIGPSAYKAGCAVQMVQLALDMLLTPSGDLDPVYVNSVSEVQHLSVIQQHLSTDRNACMTEALASWAAQSGEPIMRLLRLTSRCYLDIPTCALCEDDDCDCMAYQMCQCATSPNAFLRRHKLESPSCACFA